MKTNLISTFFYNLNNYKEHPEIQALIPMGYSPGIPVLTSRQGELCVDIPFLRYRITGQKDRTLVFPVKFVATYVVPEMNMVSFVNLAFTDMAKNVDFNKPVGFFRHEAIADLTRQQYDELREHTLTCLDRLAYCLLNGGNDPENEENLANDMSLIVEPSLYPFYKSLSPKFFLKFINNG